MLLQLPKSTSAIQDLDNEVNNGGFAQYYFNSSVEHWQCAQKRLAAIGAQKRLQLMSATVERFSPSTPSTDHNIRVSQLSTKVLEEDDPFNKQDRAWNRTDDEHLDQLMLKFNLANLDGRWKAEPTDRSD